MVRARRMITILAVANALLLLIALQFASPVAADDVKSASAAAFGVDTAPVPINENPGVSTRVPPGPDSESSDSLLEIPADPLATSFTAHVETSAAIKSKIDALLRGTIDGAAQGLPEKFNARGYAIAEDLEAVMDNVRADVIEAEALAACFKGKIVFATAARVLNLGVGPQNVGIINPAPNQVVFDQAGIRIVLWETNWDPEGLGTTDKSKTVFVNALHVTAPGGVEVIVSHAEATAECAGAAPAPPQKRPPKPEPAPPAEPVERQPAFSG
ncbi:MAG: choice-of-anchor P family protein [Actinomycetota bacterium]